MNRTLSIVGLVLTVGYVIGVYWLFGWEFAQIRNMRPNEVGDFLTGVFGPLAILWLILGFSQQGIELRQNTEALTMQVEELRNSAHEQRELVATTRQQLITERDHLALRRAEFEQSLLPRFFYSGLGSTTKAEGFVYQVHIRNLGAIASHVSIEATPPFASLSTHEFSVFVTAQEYLLEFQFQPGHPHAEDRLTMTFRDTVGRPGKADYAFVLNSAGAFCDIVRTDA